MWRITWLLWCTIIAHGACAQYFQNSAFALGVVETLSFGENGAGLSVVDINQDGWDDLTFCNSDGAPVFFIYNDGFYQEVVLVDQIPYEIKQCNWVDYDDDGLRDLVLSCYQGPMYFFHNDGDLVLTDVTSSTGIDFNGLETYGNSWCDYDRDGDLDVYISNYNGPFFGDPSVENFLYNNNGDGTFTDVTAFAGVGNGPSYSFLNVWMYANDDMWPDIFISNDRFESENALYLNNGDGTFTDVSQEAQVNYALLSMGVAIDDYDNDGDDDIYVGDWANNILLNNQNGVFENVTAATGVDINRFTWGTNFGDVNNDMFKDLFIATQSNFMAVGQNQLLLGNGSAFTNATVAAGLGTDANATYGAAFSDLNRDGAVDMVCLDIFPGYHAVWMNTPNENKYLEVELHGNISNSDGVGARIVCYTNDVMQTNVVRIGESYLSQNSLVEHFGVGAFEQIDSLIVYWPSGLVDKYFRVEANQRVSLYEGNSFFAEINSNANELAFCSGASALLTVTSPHGGDVVWSTGDQGDDLQVSQPGAYWALVEDEFGNTFFTNTIEASYFEPYPYQLERVDASCFGDTSTIQVISNSEWNQIVLNGEVISLEASAPLHIGWNGLVMTDVRDCTVIDSVFVEALAPIQGIINVNSVDCAGDSNGAISIQLTGGVPPYSWIWGNAEMFDLPASTYMVAAEDAQGCLWQQNIAVTEPAIPVPTLNITSPSCFGANDGSIDLSWQGSLAGYQVMTSWIDSDEIQGGLHWIELVDWNACETYFPITVEEPLPINLSFVVTPSEEGQANGAIDVFPSGGTPPYTFWWNSGQGNVSSIAGLPAGNYLINCIDANGCAADSTIAVTSEVGVSEKWGQLVFCYPNPVVEHLHVLEEVQNVEFFDSTGRRIPAERNGRGQYDVKTWPTGVYLLKGYFRGQAVQATIIKSL